MRTLQMHPRENRRLLRKRLAGSRGFMLWYMLAAVGGILVFYFIFFLFWAQIKGWFISGS